MIGMVIVGHGRVASEMKHAVEHVLGAQACLETLDVLSSTHVEALEQQLQASLERCNQGKGVLMLADMFGGTPCNIALRCMRAGVYEVVSGFNLPALMRAATQRGTPDVDVHGLAQDVVKAGAQYMCVASDAVHVSARVKQSA